MVRAAHNGRKAGKQKFTGNANRKNLPQFFNKIANARCSQCKKSSRDLLKTNKGLKK